MGKYFSTAVEFFVKNCTIKENKIDDHHNHADTTVVIWIPMLIKSSNLLLNNL